MKRNPNLKNISIISVITKAPAIMKKNFKNNLANTPGESNARQIQTIPPKGMVRIFKNLLVEVLVIVGECLAYGRITHPQLKQNKKI